MIADIKIALRHHEQSEIAQNFKPFITDEPPEYEVEFQEVYELPEVPEKYIYKGRSFSVYKEAEGFRRCFFDGLNEDYPYAVGRYDWVDKKIFIDYIPYGQQFLNETGNSFFHISWETILMNENRMMLHSSCINTSLGGILFSGVSGVGKSTQAELWCNYENARLINGDRTILCPTEDGWVGYGSPYAGSSKCYRNEKCNIRAIVLLKKAERCSIRRMAMGEAFRKIYSGMTINSWDENFVAKACEFITRLIQEIPVYELSCTKNADAVVCLKNELLEADIDERE